MSGANGEFQDLFNSEDLADAELVIMHGQQELRRLPGHRVLLCKRSEFFRAQGRNWQPQTSTKSQTTSAASQAAGDSSRPLLNVTVDEPAHEDAALAVIAALYGVDANMRRLPQHMLVHAAVLADRLQAPAATATALDLLKAAAASPDGVSTATIDALAGSGAAWPTCLVPLLPVLAGDRLCLVQEQWRQRRCHSSSCSRSGQHQAHGAGVGVCSGRPGADVCRPAAQQHVQGAAAAGSAAVAGKRPADGYVRRHHAVCGAAVLPAAGRASHDTGAHGAGRSGALPQLSQFRLTALAAGDDAEGQAPETTVDKFMLQRYGSSLKKMAQLVWATRGDEAPQQFVAQEIPSAPAAWGLGPRRIKPEAAAGVDWLWQLPVSELKAACLSCGPDKQRVELFSLPSPPASGLAWQANVQCEWKQDEGVQVGFYVRR